MVCFATWCLKRALQQNLQSANTAFAHCDPSNRWQTICTLWHCRFCPFSTIISSSSSTLLIEPPPSLSVSGWLHILWHSDTTDVFKNTTVWHFISQPFTFYWILERKIRIAEHQSVKQHLLSGRHPPTKSKLLLASLYQEEKGLEAELMLWRGCRAFPVISLWHKQERKHCHASLWRKLTNSANYLHHLLGNSTLFFYRGSTGNRWFITPECVSRF